MCRIEKDIDTKNIWVWNKICSGKISINPLLVACMMNKVKPLHIMLPKVSTYVKSYDGQTKWIYFLIEFFDWTKYNAIWDKVNAYIQKEFDSKPVYDKKSYGDEVTDFYNKKISMVKWNHTFLAIISLDSALEKDGNYYPQVLLKGCKYTENNVFDNIDIGKCLT